MNVDALEQLIAMRDRSLITEEEYQAKRAEILGRLTPPEPPPPLAPLVTSPASATTVTPPPAKAKSESSAVGGLLLILLIGGGWWFFGRGSGSPSLPSLPDPGWTPPSGFTRFNGDIAYRWVDPAAGDCIGDRCWAMEIVARAGCSTSLYVELALEDSAGTNVGYTNDVAGALSAGQKARLAFDSFETGVSKARLTEVTCY